MEHGKNNQKTTANPLIKLLMICILFFCVLLYGCSDQKKAQELNQIEPMAKNSDAFVDGVTAMEEGKPVMIVLLDGFGYGQYEKASQKGYANFLSTIPNLTKARTYMPSISPVGLAAMVSGVGPEKNGIKVRGDMDLLVEDIFEKADHMGKSSILIEGDMKLINTSIDPRLNADQNGDGLTDEEVFADAKKQLEKQPDLLFIHFHGIDDVAHEFSPDSQQALDRVDVLDGYAAQLVALWNGDVIITADHGQHDENGKGMHGEDRPEDMEIPYWKIEK